MIERSKERSCGLPRDQRFGRRGDIGHQLRRRLQIPIGVRDIGVPQIGRQGDEVPGDRIALCAALLQHSCRKAVAKIVDARPPRPLRSNIRKLQDATECTVHRTVGELLPFTDRNR